MGIEADAFKETRMPHHRPHFTALGRWDVARHVIEQGETLARAAACANVLTSTVWGCCTWASRISESSLSPGIAPLETGPATRSGSAGSTCIRSSMTAAAWPTQRSTTTDTHRPGPAARSSATNRPSNASGPYGPGIYVESRTSGVAATRVAHYNERHSHNVLGNRPMDRIREVSGLNS